MKKRCRSCGDSPYGTSRARGVPHASANSPHLGGRVVHRTRRGPGVRLDQGMARSMLSGWPRVLRHREAVDLLCLCCRTSTGGSGPSLIQLRTGRAGDRAGDHLLAGRGGPVLLLPPGGPVRRAGASPCPPPTARARPGACPGRGRRCCAGPSMRPAKRTPAPDHRYYAAVKDRKNSKRACLPEARKILPAGPSHPGRARPRRARRRLTHRGQLPPGRCQPLPARTGQADGLIRLSGRIPAGGDTRSIIMSPGPRQAPRAQVRLAAPGLGSPAVTAHRHPHRKTASLNR